MISLCRLLKNPLLAPQFPYFSFRSSGDILLTNVVIDFDILAEYASIIIDVSLVNPAFHVGPFDLPIRDLLILLDMSIAFSSPY